MAESGAVDIRDVARIAKFAALPSTTGVGPMAEEYLRVA